MNVNRLVFALVPLLASLAWTQHISTPFRIQACPLKPASITSSC